MLSCGECDSAQDQIGHVAVGEVDGVEKQGGRPAGENNSRPASQLACEAFDQFSHGTHKAIEDAAANGLFGVSSHGLGGLENIDGRQLGSEAVECFCGHVEAGQDGPSQKDATGADGIDGDGGTELDDDDGALHDGPSGPGGEDAINADGSGVFDGHFEGERDVEADLLDGDGPVGKGIEDGGCVGAGDAGEDGLAGAVGGELIPLSGEGIGVVGQGIVGDPVHGAEAVLAGQASGHVQAGVADIKQEVVHGASVVGRGPCCGIGDGGGGAPSHPRGGCANMPGMNQYPSCAAVWRRGVALVAGALVLCGCTMGCQARQERPLVDLNPLSRPWEPVSLTGGSAPVPVRLPVQMLVLYRQNGLDHFVAVDRAQNAYLFTMDDPRFPRLGSNSAVIASGVLGELGLPVLVSHAVSLEPAGLLRIARGPMSYVALDEGARLYAGHLEDLSGDEMLLAGLPLVCCWLDIRDLSDANVVRLRSWSVVLEDSEGMERTLGWSESARLYQLTSALGSSRGLPKPDDRDRRWFKGGRVSEMVYVSREVGPFLAGVDLKRWLGKYGRIPGRPAMCEQAAGEMAARIGAISDETLERIVARASYSDAGNAADVLAALKFRRDAIVEAYRSSPYFALALLPDDRAPMAETPQGGADRPADAEPDLTAPPPMDGPDPADDLLE